MNSMRRLEYSLSRDTIDSGPFDRVVSLLRVESIGNLLNLLDSFLICQLMSTLVLSIAHLL